MDGCVKGPLALPGGGRQRETGQGPWGGRIGVRNGVGESLGWPAAAAAAAPGGQRAPRGLSHEAPLVLRGSSGSRGGPPPCQAQAQRPLPDSAQQLRPGSPWQTCIRPTVESLFPSFSTKCRVRRAALTWGRLKPSGPPWGLAPYLPCPALVTPHGSHHRSSVPVTPLQPGPTPEGEGLPPHPPCPRLMLRYGPQISAQPFVTTGPGPLPPELLAAGFWYESLHEPGARAPGLSPGGTGLPEGFPQAARPHSWPSPHCPGSQRGRRPRSPVAPLLAPALSLRNASMKDPRPPTGAVGWVSIYFLLPGPGCHWLEERELWWVLSWPQPATVACSQNQILKGAEGPEDRPVRVGGGVSAGGQLRRWWRDGAAHPLLGAAAVSGLGSVLLVLARPGPPSQRFHESQGPCCGGLLIPGGMETLRWWGVLICPSPGPPRLDLLDP